MAYDFPNSPTVGQVANGYVWDGQAWRSSNSVAPVVATKKNYIINGAMMISQENGNTAGTTQSYYVADLFRTAGVHSGAFQAVQDGTVTPAGSLKRFAFTVTTADAAVAAADLQLINTVVEGYRIADLGFGTAAAKTFTLQFGVRAPAGTYCVSFQNSAGDRSYIAEYVIAAGEANTDVIKSITLTGDTTGTWLKDNGAGLVIWWGLMVGTTYHTTAGAWGAGTKYGTVNQFNILGTIANAFHLFDVSLTEGPTAPPFVTPDYASELVLCHRYFEARPSGSPIGTGHAQSTVQAYIVIPFEPKRATPTMVNTSTIALYSSAGSTLNCNALTPLSSSPYMGFVAAGVASGLTAGQGTELVVLAGQFNISARL